MAYEREYRLYVRGDLAHSNVESTMQVAHNGTYTQVSWRA